MSACKTFSHQQVHQLLDEVLGPGLHAKRIASLADAALGVMHTASLAVCTIGHGLAVARSLNARHAVKQVDRMLSNPGWWPWTGPTSMPITKPPSCFP